MQALLLPIGADWYAVELAVVREVVPSVAVTPLPRAPRAVRGLFNLRGEVVPLFDAGIALGQAPVAAGGHVAIVDTFDGLAGLATGGRTRRAMLGAVAGPASVTGGIERRAVDGLVATLIDVDELLAAARAPEPAR